MIKNIFVVMVGLLVLPMLASAALIDLTTPGSSGVINGAIFLTPATVTSGTGLIDSFLRIQAANAVSESGYNTDGLLEFDTKPGAFTHSLQLSALQTNLITIGGIDYYEFVLDVNETTGNSIISLLELEFYIDSASNNTGYPSIGTLVYEMIDPVTGDDGVILDYNNFTGSGKLDMILLAPASVFGTDLTQYVYLYSKFGEPDDVVDDGFEEWAHKTTGTFTGENGNGDGAIPEPGTLILLGSGLAGLAGYGKLRFRRKRK